MATSPCVHSSLLYLKWRSILRKSKKRSAVPLSHCWRKIVNQCLTIIVRCLTNIVNLCLTNVVNLCLTNIVNLCLTTIVKLCLKTIVKFVKHNFTHRPFGVWFLLMWVVPIQNNISLNYKPLFQGKTLWFQPCCLCTWVYLFLCLKGYMFLFICGCT